MPATILTTTVNELIHQEALPESYADTVKQTILPLAQSIHQLRQQKDHPVLVGIHGAQGTGKSTLTLFLKTLLTEYHGLPTACFSLDDLYLTRAERQHLADTVHPLLLTRGVPGTHDIVLGQQVIGRLKTAEPDQRTPIPAFDKSRDDRCPPEDWPVFQGRAEIILVEGWCLGARAETDEQALRQPLNALERQEDPDVVWRHHVNGQLQSDYRRFFDQLDCLIMLRASSMECVLQWRTLQEHKLAERIRRAPKQGDHGASSAQQLRIMSDDEVARFIMHYERITRACLAEMPGRADVVIEVGEDHSLGLPHIKPGLLGSQP